MNIKDLFLKEWEYESEMTLKVLNALPEDQFGWKPHEKSMLLGKLAYHLADIPNWANFILLAPEIDFAQPFENNRPDPLTKADVLAHFAKTSARLIEILNGASEALFDEPWSIRFGEKVLITYPKGEAYRDTLMNHLVHHRGQLTVYLRLLNVPVPATYGPSADDSTGLF
jgi:uncharacterized damage-inducible protein DinB